MIKGVLLNPLTAIVIAVLVGLSVFSMQQSLKPIKIGENSLAELSKEKAALEAEIQATQQKIEIASDPFYQEKKLRDELLLQKPEETVLLIPDVSPIPIPTPAPTTPTTPWQEWQEVLGMKLLK